MLKYLHGLIGITAVGILIGLIVYFNPLWVMLAFSVAVIAPSFGRTGLKNLLDAKLQPNIQRELRHNAFVSLLMMLMIVFPMIVSHMSNLAELQNVTAIGGGLIVGTQCGYLLFTVPVYVNYRHQ